MRLVRLHPPLMFTAAVMTVLAVIATSGVFVDDRVLLGVPIWLKPLKFAISFAIYTVTLAWLVSLLQRRRRTAWWLGTVVAITAVTEVAIIVGQAVRSRPSHFNVATPLDSVLFQVMGLTIVVLWVANVWVAVLLLRQRIPDRPAALAVRMGLIVTLIGLSVGFLMLRPTPEQAAAMTDGPPTTAGAHSVGVADGSPGLPLVNWGTEGGDLRAAHFVGMHALQALPLLAFGLSLLARRISRLEADRTRLRLVAVAGFGWAGLTVLLTWQALRGQSVVHPDALTLTLLASLFVLVASGAISAFMGKPSDRGFSGAPAVTPDGVAAR
jgi:hypothetical protein